MPKQIPVYLFVGQLESGKTKFIQETMEDPNFDSGDKTLLLVCEEGEIEYDPSKFAFGGVHVAQIEDKSELTAENLTALEKKSGCGRVIIEYNGMWLIQELYDALPDNWLIYQSLATADGTTIKTYAGDSAMRSLLLDKLRGSELLVVNRAEAVNDDESRQLIHKLAALRSAFVVPSGLSSCHFTRRVTLRIVSLSNFSLRRICAAIFSPAIPCILK